jgi:hypothetical protein
MLALDALGLCSNANALRYWHLPIIKNYPLPKYYIGQLVLHCINHPQGEILHPVTVIGLFWGCGEWTYMIEFPADHPMFERESSELDEVEEHQLEPM